MIVMITILINKMDAWMKTPQAKQKIDEVRLGAWNDFKSRYPYADMKQFDFKIDINGTNDVTGTVQFYEGPGCLRIRS